MPEFHFDPLLCPVRPGDLSDGFLQTIRLFDGDRALGVARWHAPIDAAEEGVVQLVELFVSPGLERHGHGGRLYDEVLKQARAYLKARGARLRRLWCNASQKAHIRGRSFLTEKGFHHVAAAGNVLRDEDIMLYVKAYD